MGKKYIHCIVICFAFILLLVIPSTTAAQITINEIQYNPEGTDGGYEWIEIYNNSDSPYSVEDFTFRESDKNHRLTHTNESLGWLLPSKGYGIIADNPTKFLEKHPGFPGLLFDSSFTLVNTGELLELLNSDDELIYGFEYNPVWGGDGDGSTLGVLNTIWKATSPTPGRANVLFVAEGPEDTSTETISENTEMQEQEPETQINIPATYIQLADPEYKEKTIKADAGPDRTLLVGVPFLFTGTGYGLAGGILDDPHYLWNFGDGTRATGKQVLHHFIGPGSYTGTLKVIAGGYSHVDHFKINVIPPELKLTMPQDQKTLTVINNSPHTIELSGFIIETNEQKFIFPEESFISENSQITLDAKVMGLALLASKPIHLLGPNGYKLDSYHEAITQIRKQISIKKEKLEKNTQPVTRDLETTQDKLEEQIVYIGVPQYIEPEVIATPDVHSSNIPVSNSNPVTQAASLSNIKRELLSPFEIGLLVLFGAVVAGFGFLEFSKYRKKQESSVSIQIDS